MRISVMTVGSRGDLQPFLALAGGLRQAGHDVTMATHTRFRDAVTSEGVAFAALPGDPLGVARSPRFRRLQAPGAPPLLFAPRFSALLRPWFQDLVAAVTPIHRASDLVVYSPLSFPSWHLSQADGTPTVLASLQPFTPTRRYPAVTLGGADLGSWGNLASHHLVRQLLWQPIRRLVNGWRTRELGLPPLPLLGPWRELGEEPEIDGYSRHVVPRPRDWPGRVTITGYWFLPERPHRPSSTLQRFLAAGPPPVFVGFGSTDPGDAELLSRIAVGAARRVGRRLVLAEGWAGMQAEGDDVVVVGDVPHSWLFPRMAAVVHHGGAGTTAAGLRAGAPTVVVPFSADQPFWGRRVWAIGAGPRPVPRGRLDETRLATAIAEALDPEVRARAGHVGDAIRGEDGVGRAVEAVERAGAAAGVA